jgi:exopolysaccharide production protein ExoQ
MQSVAKPGGMLTHVNTWLLCGILLVFASMYGFSFERGSMNTTSGARLADQGVSGMDSESNAVIQIQRDLIYCLCAILMFPHCLSIGSAFRKNLLIAALPLWATLSLLWSNDPRLSLTNGVFLTLNIALAFYLAQRYAGDPNELLKLLILIGSIAASASLLLVLLVPQYGLQGRSALYAFGAWQGIFGHKNICGAVMTFLLLPAFFVKLGGRSAKLLRLTYIVVLLTIIGLTRSAGAWLECGSCLVFIGTVRLLGRLKKMDTLAIGLAVVGVLVAVALAVYTFADALLSAIGKDPSMTGRTIIWASVISSILKRPLVGYGYMAFWQGLSGESANTALQMHWPGMSYAENGVLELWLELGAVGVVLYAVAYLRAVKDAIYCFKRRPSPIVLWYISVLFFVAASNISGGNLLYPSALVCIVPLIAFVGLRQEARSLRRVQAQ